MCHSWSNNCMLACRLPQRGTGRIYIFMFAWVKMSNFNHREKEIMMKCFEPNWSFSCEWCICCNSRAPLFFSSVFSTIMPRQMSSLFPPAHTSEGQSESKRQGEKERGKRWQQVTTIHPADCLHNPSSNSGKRRREWFRAQTLALSLFSVILHTDLLFLICFIIHSDYITGLWNICSTQKRVSWWHI